jgi:branched-chain amino acid transport system ATP-binding protein
MLDEPAAGISPSERGRLVDLLRSLDKDISLLLIEHDMAIALAVADHVIVMHDGNMFMQGTPDEIRDSAEVRDLYLGHGHE